MTSVRISASAGIIHTTVWFTSDTHFNHANIIKHSERQFSDLDDMTATIIDRWNRQVKSGDIIYHLGDFALSWGKRHAELIDDLLGKLNGNKWLIVGNHDRDGVTKNARWIKAKHYHEIRVDLRGVHKQKIIMCHYPIRVWNHMNRGSWMLHGHSHGSLTDIGGCTMDVGVDCHDFQPISADEIVEFMKGREAVQCDHTRLESENRQEPFRARVCTARYGVAVHGRISFSSWAVSS